MLPEWLIDLWHFFLEWWYVILGGWLFLAAVVGLIVGRVIRNRDKQEARPLPWETQDMQNLPPKGQTTRRPVSGS